MWVPTKQEEGEIFKKLAYQSSFEVGISLNLDKHYPDNASIKQAIDRVYAKVKLAPENYGVAQETALLVTDARAHRNLNGAMKEVSKAEKEIESKDITALVVGTRDKTFRLIDQKLTRISKSKKKLDEIPLQSLGTIAGILFDKAQIIQGQATEHVALIGKIEGNLDPKQAMDLILKMREKNIADKMSAKT